MAEVTVIVPVYNVEDYLEPCMESIINQTFSDLEIILVDDGSTDSSSEICDNYAQKDSRIVVIHKANGGQSSARNLGLERATGNWFTFVDSDDICELTLVEKLYEAVAKYGTVLSFAYVGRLFGDTKKTMHHGPVKNVFPSSEMITRFLGSGEFGDSVFTCACVKLFKYEAFSEMRFREGIIYEDDDLASKLYLKDFDIAFVDETLYWYRCRPGSTVRSGFSKKKCILTDVLQRRAKLFIENGYIKEAEKTANEGCDIHLELYLKAKKAGHPEWVTEFDSKFRYMKKVCKKRAPLKSRVRYFIYSVSPFLYGLYGRIKGA